VPGSYTPAVRANWTGTVRAVIAAFLLLSERKMSEAETLLDVLYADLCLVYGSDHEESRDAADLRAAEAYAVDGDLTNTRRAMDAAFDRFADPIPDHGEPDWAYWLDLTHAHGQAGYCYLRLGQPATSRPTAATRP
jgi:hypothetical protein